MRKGRARASDTDGKSILIEKRFDDSSRFCFDGSQTHSTLNEFKRMFRGSETEDDCFTFEVLAVQQVTVPLPTTAAPVRGVTLAHGEQLEMIEIGLKKET